MESITIEDTLKLLSEGLQKTWTRHKLADYCRSGQFTPYFEFVGGVSKTTQIDFDFNNVPPSLGENAHKQPINNPQKSTILLYNELLLSVVRNPKRTAPVNYGKEYDPRTGEVYEDIYQLCPIGYFNAENVNLLDTYTPPNDYFYEVTTDDILFSKSRIMDYIKTINMFDDLTEPKTTPADDEPKESVYHLVNAMKTLLLDPQLTGQFFQDKDNENAPKKPTQTMLAKHIESMKIRNLGERTINGIFAQANKIS
ncbi:MULTISPECIES: hypothetical protein [unclassified Moraxella]|uniref:hypothetical protein n=1 Tax=unclassified Moraxella TaxID=2685852 RepID=UPI003AF4DADD